MDVQQRSSFSADPYAGREVDLAFGFPLHDISKPREKRSRQ